jgi:hypothetical protein
LSASSTSSFDSILRDMFPCAGDRLKQYVVDSRRESAWEAATCPRFPVPEHEDNTGAVCRNSNERVPWTALNHDCCHDCGDFHEAMRTGTTVVAWLAEKAKRPPIETDHEKLSDEIAPDVSLGEHPFFAMLKKERG